MHGSLSHQIQKNTNTNTKKIQTQIQIQIQIQIQKCKAAEREDSCDALSKQTLHSSSVQYREGENLKIKNTDKINRNPGLMQRERKHLYL